CARALVVYGADGVDELSLSAPTQVCEVDGAAGELREYTITPDQLGLTEQPREAMLGGDAQQNAALLRDVLSGQTPGAPADMVALNAGAALYISGRAASLTDGVKQAQAALQSGRASATLEQLASVSQKLATVVA